MGNIWKRLINRVEATPPRPLRAGAAWIPSTVASAPSIVGNEPEAEAIDSAELEDRFLRHVLDMPASTRRAASPDERSMLRRLEQVIGDERYDLNALPRLPSVLPQLLRMLKSEDSDGAKLAALIGRDPILVGEVMRAAQSAYYRTLTPIASLRHAVVLLGQDGLRQMVTLHVMKPILQASAGMLGHAAGQRLWEHAERCAHAAMSLARNGQGDPFEAYLAGVICHGGLGAMIRVLDQEAPASLGSYSQPFLAACGRLSRHLSWRAAEHWELAPNVVLALRERAAPAQPPARGSLGTCLQAAEQLASLQVLTEHGVFNQRQRLRSEHLPDLAEGLLERARQELRRQFRAFDTATA